MKRMHAVELEDLPWFPAPIRDGITDLLQFHARFGFQYGPVVSILSRALKKARSNHVVDLCSGGGGPWLYLHKQFKKTKNPVRATLTDFYPNQEALKQARKNSMGRLDYYPNPVDATNVPDALKGFRTLFAAFHHFKPEQARAILEDAVNNREGIAVFDYTDRSPAVMAAMFGIPLWTLAVTPFIRPFRWSRLALTYLVPAIPLSICWDGIASCIRSYTPEELTGLAQGLDDDYVWETGRIYQPPALFPITWCVGIPRQNKTEKTNG